MAELDGYVGIREDRAYWQMVITGEVRGLLLRKGAALVQGGRIDRADDILFLMPDEVEGNASSDLRPLVSERRREWERWCQVVPPSTIGTPAIAPAAVEISKEKARIFAVHYRQGDA